MYNVTELTLRDYIFRPTCKSFNFAQNQLHILLLNDIFLDTDFHTQICVYNLNWIVKQREKKEDRGLDSDQINKKIWNMSDVNIVLCIKVKITKQEKSVLFIHMPGKISPTY